MALALQRTLALAVSPLTTLAVAGLLRFWLRLRVEDREAARQSWRAIWRAREGPLLVCANHLTMIDSALIAWALAPPLWYVGHFSALPWNVPERTHFASTLTQRVLVYLYKCLPIVRGGSRDEVADTLARFAFLLSRGEVGLIFAQIGVTAGVLSNRLFSAIVFVVLATTLVTPPLLKRAFESGAAPDDAAA